MRRTSRTGSAMMAGGLTALTVAAMTLGAPSASGAAGCPDGGLDATTAKASTVQAAVVCEVNLRRKAKGLRPVSTSSHLGKAAQQFAERLAKAGKLDHKLNGTTPSSRARAAGYKYWKTVVDEDLATGQTTATSVIAAWMGDAPHRRAIISARREIGVGYANGYWVIDFGRTG